MNFLRNPFEKRIRMCQKPGEANPYSKILQAQRRKFGLSYQVQRQKKADRLFQDEINNT